MIATTLVLLGLIGGVVGALYQQRRPTVTSPMLAMQATPTLVSVARTRAIRVTGYTGAYLILTNS